MDLDLRDPFDRLNELEQNLLTATEQIQHLSQILRNQSQVIEQLTNYFKPVAHRLDLNLKEIRELQRRVEYLEAIND